MLPINHLEVETVEFFESTLKVHLTCDAILLSCYALKSKHSEIIRSQKLPGKLKFEYRIRYL